MIERKGVYQRIFGEAYRHIYVVGDLHGCYTELITELAKVEFDESRDLLISVGDLVDRGNDSLACLRLMKCPWFKAVQGNHEEMAFEGVTQNNGFLQRRWYQNGGDWFWDLAGIDRHEAWSLIKDTQELPLVIELITPGKTTVIAHADYPEDVYEYGKKINNEKTLWSRDRYMRLRNGEGARVTGADTFYFGHTPDKTVISVGNHHYIDTGCVFGDKLTVVRIK